MGFYCEHVFPRLNDLVTRPLVRQRRRLLEEARGAVLEIGFGSGLSVPCYPPAIETLTGLDPSPGMLARARASAPAWPRPVRLVEACSESLPFSDRSFDCVVSILTLCSVRDLARSLQEIRRVLRPGGLLLFLEHAGQPVPCLTQKLQETLAPAWRLLGCGCHLTRQPLEAMQHAGLEVGQVNIVGHNGFPNLVSPIYRGQARAS
ncbi:MAG: class I SAM-dependent methyltransferase [Candidatus Xenobia bacterium]